MRVWVELAQREAGRRARWSRQSARPSGPWPRPACLYVLQDGCRHGHEQSRHSLRREEETGRGHSRGRARQRISSRRDEGQWEAKAKVYALAHWVQRLAQECDEGNRNMTLLEDTLEWEGEVGRLRDEL